MVFVKVLNYRKFVYFDVKHLDIGHWTLFVGHWTKVGHFANVHWTLDNVLCPVDNVQCPVGKLTMKPIELNSASVVQCWTVISKDVNLLITEQYCNTCIFVINYYKLCTHCYYSCNNSPTV